MIFVAITAAVAAVLALGCALGYRAGWNDAREEFGGDPNDSGY